MKKTAYEYLTTGAYMRSGVCALTYRPITQKKTRFKYFDTLKEGVAWCRRRRGKIIAYSGSWQLLDTLDGKDIFSPEYWIPSEEDPREIPF